MYRFISPLIVLVPQDLNLTHYAQVCCLCCVFYSPVEQFLYFLFSCESFPSFFYRYSAGLTTESPSHMVLKIVNVTVI